MMKKLVSFSAVPIKKMKTKKYIIMSLYETIEI